VKEFTDWIAIDTDVAFFGPAGYELRLVEGGSPVPIGRMLGVDSEGILVIGYTRSMADRCRQSRSGRRSANGSSTTNWLYYLERHSSLLIRYPNIGCEYHYAVAGSVREAKAWEEQRLKRYWCRFGEPPPLNSIIPNRYGRYEPDVHTAVEVE
jgi:hypothetical protein